MKIFACVAVVISVEVLGVLGGSGKNRHLSSLIYFIVNIIVRIIAKAQLLAPTVPLQSSFP